MGCLNSILRIAFLTLLLVLLWANPTGPRNAQKPVTNVSTTEQAIVSKLTSHRFQLRGDHEHFSEGYSYQFLPDGTFKWNIIADYNDSGDGLWNFKGLSENEGLLFLFWKSGGPSVGTNLKQQGHVLYFRFISNGRLNLAGDILEGVKLAVGNDAIRRGRLPDILKETAFTNYFRLVGHSWEKSDTKDNRFIPDSYLLREDGTFIARYRNGSCHHGGRWSLTENLLLEAESTTCDLRGSRGAVRWNQGYVLEGDLLILDGKYRYHRGK